MAQAQANIDLFYPLPSTLTPLPISPSYVLNNFSQEHHITSAHVEKLDDFLGSQNQPSLSLNRESPLTIRQFTKNTSQSLLKQSGSHGNHVISDGNVAFAIMAAGN